MTSENCNYLTHSSANLVNPDDLTLDAVVLSSGATGPLVSWHVHTHHMLISGKKLAKKVAFVLTQLPYYFSLQPTAITSDCLMLINRRRN